MRERVSVIVPARDEASRLGDALRAVRAQTVPGRDVAVDLVVVDDGSTDGTSEVAWREGARVVRLEGSGNPGAARNRGAEAAAGDPLVFLDADCVPRPGWLAALLGAHDATGADVVGGALGMPAGLSPTARCDYYASAYHQSPRRPAGEVPHTSPANLSVRRAAFEASGGFSERLPVADGHEELAWQAALRRAGGRIVFEPRAVALHRNRPGLGPMLRRAWRWGYSAVPAKCDAPSVRAPWLYRDPRLAVAAVLPVSVLQSAHTVGAWLRRGVAEPVLFFPAVLLARIAYGVAAAVGGWRWLRGRL